jgi:FkbM family methyltransferase
MIEQKVENNNYWVLYPRHTEPTLELNSRTQQDRRTLALKYVKRWNNCIDIGSCVGMWTRELASKFKKVYCFEPNPNFIECFNKNITENNVELFRYGLSYSEHTASQEQKSTILNETEGNVICKTLDSFNLKDIDFIKIDVDGFEHKVLRGAVETIRNNSPAINIELKYDKRKDTVNHCMELLTRLGYNRVNRVRYDEIWLKS